MRRIGLIARVDVQSQNRWGRPVRFLVTDTHNERYTLAGEEFRWAVNYGAGDAPIPPSGARS